MEYLAQINIAPPGGFKGPGDKGLLAAPGTGISLFAKFLSSTIGLMTIIAIIWFIFTFFIGAIGMISAGSDKQALEGARKKIITGITGLVVTLGAIFVIRLIGFLLGFEDILNLEKLFSNIIK